MIGFDSENLMILLNPLANTLRLPSGDLVLMNMRHDPTCRIGFKIMYLNSGVTIDAYLVDGTQLWSKTWPFGQYVSGGFDADKDGYVDLVIECAEPLSGGATCATLEGLKAISQSWLELVAGIDGRMLHATTRETDYCWSGQDKFQYWQAGNVTFGASSDTVAFEQWHMDDATSLGYFWKDGGDLTRVPFYYYPPSNPSYGSYTQAVVPYGQPPGSPKWVMSSSAGNGLIMPYNGVERLVFFSSGRAYEYNSQALGVGQLRADCPFTGHPSASGRSYGLVCTDPMSATRVLAVSGGQMLAYYDDTISGQISHDPYCGVERHVTSYNVSANSVDNRWVGSHYIDPPLTNLMRFPAHVLVPSTGTQSHVVYNRFDGSHWRLIVTSAITVVQNALLVMDEIAWDCRDIDGDGFHEIITSPIDIGKNGGNYFPQFKTRVWRWDPLTKAMLFLEELDGLPHIIQGFQEGNTRFGPRARTDGYGAGLCPVLIGDEGGGLGIYTRDQTGNISLQIFGEII